MKVSSLLTSYTNLKFPSKFNLQVKITFRNDQEKERYLNEAGASGEVGGEVIDGSHLSSSYSDGVGHGRSQIAGEHSCRENWPMEMLMICWADWIWTQICWTRKFKLRILTKVHFRSQY